MFKTMMKGLSLVTTLTMVYMGYQAHAEVTSQALMHEEQEQIHCLAKNIYFEARGESELGQRAVAWVTLNRRDSTQYPNTICDVVWQPSQFSWTHDGRSDTPREIEAWNRAQAIAEIVYYRYLNNMADPTDGSVMFHASQIDPYWTASYNRVVQIDNHIFYN